MIELRQVSKNFGKKQAVKSVSFSILPGNVTAFLGPNGAGKSTTIRMILNLSLPSSGCVRIDGNAYKDWNTPLKKVGAMVDAGTIDPGLTPKQYLDILRSMSGFPKDRVQEMLALVGLQGVQNKKIGEFSLGMRQRASLAGALLGNPETLLLDEPFNGLDVDGIHWLRNTLRNLANQGKAILISSHLLSEVQELADRILMLVQGDLIADISMQELQKKSSSSYLELRTNDAPKLYEILKEQGAQPVLQDDGTIKVRAMSNERVGDLAFEGGLRIYELSKHHPTLEELFAELVNGKSEFSGQSLPS